MQRWWKSIKLIAQLWRECWVGGDGSKRGDNKSWDKSNFYELGLDRHHSKSLLHFTRHFALPSAPIQYRVSCAGKKKISTLKVKQENSKQFETERKRERKSNHNLCKSKGEIERFFYSHRESSKSAHSTQRGAGNDFKDSRWIRAEGKYGGGKQ